MAMTDSRHAAKEWRWYVTGNSCHVVVSSAPEFAPGTEYDSVSVKINTPENCAEANLMCVRHNTELKLAVALKYAGTSALADRTIETLRTKLEGLK